MFSESSVDAVSPIVWWKGYKDDFSDEIFTVLIDLVNQLYSASASSANIERIFWTFGVVMSKLRNRLGYEKAAKQVFLLKRFNNKE